MRRGRLFFVKLQIGPVTKLLIASLILSFTCVVQPAATSADLSLVLPSAPTVNLLDLPVSLSTNPAPSLAPLDKPKPYQDRCHVQQNLTATTNPCVYANPLGKKTVVLFGDSHALSWFPAIEKLAIAKKWRLLSLTMSSCWPADIPAWNSTTQMLMTNCAIWRQNTLKRIQSEKPYLIFVAGTRGFSTVDTQGRVLTGDARTLAWQAGMSQTLKTISAVTKNLVYLGDIPSPGVDTNQCLTLHEESIIPCATPFASAVSLGWLKVEQSEAISNGAIWIDPTSWICTTEPCSAVTDDDIDIYSEGAHLTATYSNTLEPILWRAVSAKLVG